MSLQATPEDVRNALKSVLDPEIGKDLVTLNMVKNIAVDGAKATVVVELTTPACPLKGKIEGDVRAAVSAVPGIEEVAVELTANVRSAGGPADNPISGVKNTIAVASGKGGVGKSTVAVNLAMALIEEGASVGLLDCDIYGPSIPTMTGTSGLQPTADEGGSKFLPLIRHGLSLMSIGYLVPPGESVVWRGPLIHKAVQQFLSDVDWGELDYLLIDLPPGTGDAQLSLTQTIPLTCAVMVTTPQQVSVIDVRKGADMFNKVNVPILGVIENMAYFVCPGCGMETEIFSRGGGKQIATELGVPFLGELPIEAIIREGGDNGIPAVLSHKDAISSLAFRELARNLAGGISKLHLG
jgi:ATP-binding protein involved in chromosome partitioning